MQEPDEGYVELDGVRYQVVFADDLSDDERERRRYPPRGTRCACSECDCVNDADMGTLENPICGCCLADCPDVHPTGSAGAG